MKITIESTTKIITVQGSVKARVWEGKTDSGIPVFCMVTRIGVDKLEDASQFERELQECREPTLTKLFPLSMIL